MTSNVILTLLTLIITTQSIFLMVKPKVPRCMVEYVTSEGTEQSIKITMNFPKLQNPKEYQHFYIIIRNTQTNETQTSTARSGSKYNKQKMFQKNVIYQVCINFKTDRQEDAMIQYQTQKTFKTVQHTPVVPQHLLKKQDFKETYIAASYLTQTIAQYSQEHRNRYTEVQKEFSSIQTVNKRLTALSVIEFIVLIGSGLYQFFTLRNYLSTRQYI